MDDVGKAIVMVGQILLFILACSVSIVLYSAIKNNVDMVTLYHDYSNRGGSIIASDEQQKARVVKPEEVILAVLDLKNKDAGNKVKVQISSTGSRTYEYDEVNDAITVGSGASFPYNSTNLHHELIDFMNRSSTYKLTYSGDELYYEFYN